MTHQEIEELLGAYALDAVDADEAREVEDHLAGCPRCRAEVAEHREVAALLTSGTAVAPPAGVWDKIAADLGDGPPPVPIEVAFGRRDPEPVVTAPPRRSPLLGLAAAAAIIVIALMAVVLVNQRRDLDDVRDQLAAVGNGPSEGELAALLADPDTDVVDLTGDAAGARALIGEDGNGMLLAAGLPELGADETYQLWGLPEGTDEMVSLGVLGAEPGQAAFHVEDGITTLAISREPEGGSSEPTTDPLVLGTVA